MFALLKARTSNYSDARRGNFARAVGAIDLVGAIAQGMKDKEGHCPIICSTEIFLRMVHYWTVHIFAHDSL